MSSVKIQGNASGSGQFTVASPNSNNTRTATLPDADGTLFVGGQALTATTGNFSGNVTIGTTITYPDATTQNSASGVCKAWVNFDATNAFSPNPSTSAIKTSYNVSSILRNGTGDFTINFTSSLSGADYCVTGTASRDSGATTWRILSPVNGGLLAASCRISTATNSPTAFDCTNTSVAVFR